MARARRRTPAALSGLPEIVAAESNFKPGGVKSISSRKAAALPASQVCMPRPTILVAEPEPSEALSVRKLVLETAKFNVITAHTTQEALDLFHLFPNLNVAVLVMDTSIDCERIAQSIRKATDKIALVALSARIGDKCAFADHNLSSHEPGELVDLMRSLVGDPR
jgi:CheY-like chemotaxis protein